MAAVGPDQTAPQHATCNRQTDSRRACADGIQEAEEHARQEALARLHEQKMQSVDKERARAPAAVPSV